jgi:predicted TIM-barrel fold metal-dependent hydrolase
MAKRNDIPLSRRRFVLQSGAALLAAAPGLAGPQEAYRIIDTHLHVFNSVLQGAGGIPKYMPDSTVEHHLDLMDRGGVGKAFLISYNAEDIAPEIRSRGQSPVVLLAVINRTYQIASWKAHQDRFWWFPAHVNPIHEDLIETLEKWFDMGAAGLKLLPLFHGLLPDHPGFRPVYELCRKRKKPIVIDVSWWYFGGYIGYGYNESATLELR